MNAINIIETTQSFVGGFGRSIEVFSVSRKGRLTRLTRSESCTYEGDRPSMPVEVRPDQPLMVRISHHGNGARDHYWATPSGAARLARNGLTPEQACDEHFQALKGAWELVNSLVPPSESPAGFPRSAIALQIAGEAPVPVKFEEGPNTWTSVCRPTEALLEWAAGKQFARPALDPMPDWVWELREFWQ